QWALMSENDDTLVLNWYGPSMMTASVAGISVMLEQQTDYPRDGRVIIKVNPKQPAIFKLKFRIPQWSHQTQISINGSTWTDRIKPATYLVLNREWKSGDEVILDLDLTPHIWAGEKECAGKASIYRGPILLAYNLPNKTALPTLDVKQISQATLKRGALWITLQIPSENGPIELMDYASAGAGGVRYATWLPMNDPPRTPFSKTRPLPTAPGADQR
ncbi:MAG TPA: hypothetical protein VGP94_15895, partial [Tepidisphaeraceae bacterium]|nr:hypothetical protein [Tepidisphaeraceae bacterium]